MNEDERKDVYVDPAKRTASLTSLRMEALERMLGVPYKDGLRDNYEDQNSSI